MKRTQNQTSFLSRGSSLHRCGAFLLLCTWGLSFSACPKPQTLIPGTSIVATEDNKEVIRRVEQYFQALQERDIGKIVSMAHPSYQSNFGTTDPADDYNRVGMQKILEDRIPRVRSIQIQTKYKDVKIEGARAVVRVRYNAHVQIATEQGDRFRDSQHDKEMVLQRDAGQWLFISGY